MGMLKNLLNSDNKYYLELDETKDPEAVQNVVEASSPVTEAVPEKATEVAETAPEQQNGKAAKSAVEAKQTQATTTNSGASSFEPPFWVAAMYNSNGANNGAATNNNNGTASLETFATNNLMPTVTSYRRRPGASLNKFKDMAQNVRVFRR